MTPRATDRCASWKGEKRDSRGELRGTISVPVHRFKRWRVGHLSTTRESRTYVLPASFVTCPLQAGEE